ncbi:hypothetical protein FACS1894113_3740 [Alphaproteobacteria bacterium]|nr:hypothetical protein FACS1894113_3740 [Alphaproteobacteria bacterium]
MSFYEVVFIVKQEASASHVDAVAKSVIEIIKNNGGEVSKTEFCGLRMFAYPIQKRKRGHYILLNVTAEGQCISKVERLLRLNEDVCRFLNVKVDELDNNPSALMRRATREVA